jgi:hypothetical protein
LINTAALLPSRESSSATCVPLVLRGVARELRSWDEKCTRTKGIPADRDATIGGVDLTARDQCSG